MDKIKQYDPNESNLENSLNLIDSKFTESVMEQSIIETISTIQNTSVPNYGTKINFNHFQQQNPLYFEMYPQHYLSKIELIWSLYDLFVFLTAEDFVKIFLSIIMEKSIIFFSTSKKKLTNIIISLIGLLKPLEWTNPLIHIVPQNFLQIVDSPFPFIIGLNKNQEFLQDNYYFEDYAQHIFVDLDQKKIQNEQNIEISFVLEQRFLYQIKPLYQNLGKTSSLDLTLQFIDTVQNLLVQELLIYLPKEPVYSNKDNKILNHEYIATEFVSKSGYEQEFIKQIVFSQMFNNYTQQVYQN